MPARRMCSSMAQTQFTHIFSANRVAKRRNWMYSISSMRTMVMGMRYKAILMDADHTLLDFEAAETRALRVLFDRLGIRAPQAFDEYRQINSACWQAYERGEMSQEELLVKRFEHFCAIYAPGADISAIRLEYDALLAEQSDILPHADEVVRQIAARLPVAIVTNGSSDIQRARLTKSPLWSYIAYLGISEEVGASKPRPGMIHEALRRLDIDRPSDALMIGDSVTSDMPAARAAGVDFLWYNPTGAPRPENAYITYEARDIREFVPIATME